MKTELKKKMDLMIDIETYSSEADAVIVQIGACWFDLETGKTGDEFLVNIDPESCKEYGMRVSEKTMAWWAKQEEQTFHENTVRVTKALSMLRDFVKAGPKNCKVWSHATFDTPVLHHAYMLIGEKVPWRYKDCRDIRTLVDLSGVYIRTAVDWSKKTHNALDDAKLQAEYCSLCYRKVKGLDGKV